MRSILNIATVAAVAALCALSLAPTAQATNEVQLEVLDGTGDEHYLSCPTGPGTCVVLEGFVAFTIQIAAGSWRPGNTAIRIDYELVDGTAVAGADYQGPTSGTATIPANESFVKVVVPLIADGVTEPAETFTLRLTGSNVPANLCDTGIGTVRDGVVPPSDCTATKDDDHVMNLTCTSRPPTQLWHLSVLCLSPLGGIPGTGNIVTGNGTSTYNCGLQIVARPIFVIDA